MSIFSSSIYYYSNRYTSNTLRLPYNNVKVKKKNLSKKLDNFISKVSQTQLKNISFFHMQNLDFNIYLCLCRKIRLWIEVIEPGKKSSQDVHQSADLPDLFVKAPKKKETFRYGLEEGLRT